VRRPAPPGLRRQRGAALLLAMLTVALVATLAASALWQQWRSVEVEASERSRAQADWVLQGALDWARLILREDARSGGPDHLGEPWAVELAESRLSTFLAQDGQVLEGDTGAGAFLSGSIRDAQARMNVTNLIASNQISEPDMQAFSRLFELLGLEAAELQALADNLRHAMDVTAPGLQNATASLLPRRVEQLRWLGLSEASLRKLTPHITVLPVRTTLNLNTATEEAIAASIQGIEVEDARRLVRARARAPFRSLAEASRALGAESATIALAQFSVNSGFFEVRGRLRLEDTVVEALSLVQRSGLQVTTLWRERVALDPRGPVTAGS
jgi:general secretion pathway protein K